MGGSLWEPGAPCHEAEAPARVRAARSPAVGDGTGSMVEILQRTAGNRAVVALLARSAGRTTGATVQRTLFPHKGSSDAKLHEIGQKVQAAVDSAVRTIAADPTLAAHPGKDRGYLAAWITTYKEYLADPGAVPSFYFARYGYAVETIATLLLASENINPYTFHFQIAHGHTRPDIVVMNAGTEVAWIDITSVASKGHILRKQGAGWTSRPYVAEACYDMPLPAALAKGGKPLDAETLKRIEAAQAHAAEQAAYFEIGRQAIAVDLGAALLKRFQEKGSGLSATDARGVIVATCKEKLGATATASLAKSVLYTLETIEVSGRLDTGVSWANWALPQQGLKTEQARKALIAFGQAAGS
jgi:hypothetical protein